MSSADPIQDLLSSDFATDLVEALKERHPRAAVVIAALQSSMPAVRWGRNRYRDTHRYTVRVHASDSAYDDARVLALELLPAPKRRVVSLRTDWGPMPDGRNGYIVVMEHDAEEFVPVTLEGHRATVAMQAGKMPKEAAEGGQWIPPVITFTFFSEEGRDALVRELQRRTTLRVADEKRLPSIRVLGGMGGWRSTDRLRPRPLESVILADDSLERLIADMSAFTAAEPEYERRGQPWHRGYLFSGPPGGGKTSTAHALASHFGRDLYCFSLPDLRRDGDILQCLSEVSARSVVVLEDVDIYHAATERDDDKSGPTLAGLLNSLDGIATPHGLIFILTSNNAEILDEALVRPGRVDMKVRFGWCTIAQAAAVISWWFAETLVPAPDARLRKDQTSVAAVIAACRASKTAGDAWELVFTAGTCPGGC